MVPQAKMSEDDHKADLCHTRTTSPFPSSQRSNTSSVVETYSNEIEKWIRTDLPSSRVLGRLECIWEGVTACFTDPRSNFRAIICNFFWIQLFHGSTTNLWLLSVTIWRGGCSDTFLYVHSHAWFSRIVLPWSNFNPLLSILHIYNRQSWWRICGLEFPCSSISREWQRVPVIHQRDCGQFQVHGYIENLEWPRVFGRMELCAIFGTRILVAATFNRSWGCPHHSLRLVVSKSSEGCSEHFDSFETMQRQRASNTHSTHSGRE